MVIANPPWITKQNTYTTALQSLTRETIRYSYGFQYMSIDDYQLLHSLPQAATVNAPQLVGQWSGNFILLEHPNIALLSYPQPPPLHLTITEGSGFKVRLGDGATVNISGPPATQDMRIIAADTIIGKWTMSNLDPAMAQALRDYVEPYANSFALYYVLNRS